jgi:hypothetical protein
MAMACSVMIEGPYTEDSGWMHYAEGCGASFDPGGMIDFDTFVVMAETMNEDGEMPVSCKVYDADGLSPPRYTEELYPGTVGLLYNALDGAGEVAADSGDHMIVLWSLGVRQGPGPAQGHEVYLVTNPATGTLDLWTPQQYADFDCVGAAFVKKKAM